jgi:uncharacterized protein (DUF1501 family)
MTSLISRRKALIGGATGGAILLGLGALAPAFLHRTAHTLGAAPIASTTPGRKRALVVVQLGGGNDGLNTVIPYSNDLYYQARPTISVPKSDVLHLSDEVGLNPALVDLKNMYDAGHIAIIQGVGYPNPNRSHFRSTDIWTSAVPERVESTGWLGRYVDAQCCGTDPKDASHGAMQQDFIAMDVQPATSPAFWTQHALVPALDSLDRFTYQTDPKHIDQRDTELAAFRAIYNKKPGSEDYEALLTHAGLTAVESSELLKKITAGYQPKAQFPLNNPLSNPLKLVSQLIAADLGTRVYYVSMGGFDTHANQKRVQDNLLKNFGASLNAFMAELAAREQLDDTMIMVFSEFGRRVRENGGRGTDHGTAAPMFVLGGGIRGGIYGNHPSLTDLDQGDLKYAVDFRSVYATIVKDWLGADPVSVLDGSFATLNFVAI